MIRLNDRDFQIISFLRTEGWVLSSQLSELYFKGSRHSCTNRLRRLTACGIIEPIPLNQFRAKYWHQKGLVNLFCDLDGRTKVYRLHKTMRSSLGSQTARASSDSMLAHQVVLNHVRKTLELHCPGSRITSEKIEFIKNHASREDASEQPDLVIKWESLSIAIELERKARRGLGVFNFAYEDRFENLSLKYDLVLYIVEKDDHLRRLIEKADGLRRIGFCSVLNLNEIFRHGKELSSLSEFLNEARSRLDGN